MNINDDLDSLETDVEIIANLCVAPHWTADRKEKIYTYAANALRKIDAIRKQTTPFQELPMS